MARPRLTCSGVASAGRPSTSVKELFISGCVRSALTSAYPIRWVKLTLPPRARRRWLLMTMRLSASSLAGTARTLVAVGTARLVCMLATTRAAAPRRTLGSAAGAGWSAGRPDVPLVAGAVAGAVAGFAEGLAAGWGAGLAAGPAGAGSAVGPAAGRAAGLLSAGRAGLLSAGGAGDRV